jgi:hypothetical protein
VRDIAGRVCLEIRKMSNFEGLSRQAYALQN